MTLSTNTTQEQFSEGRASGLGFPPPISPRLEPTSTLMPFRFKDGNNLRPYRTRSTPLFTYTVEACVGTNRKQTVYSVAGGLVAHHLNDCLAPVRVGSCSIILYNAEFDWAAAASTGNQVNSACSSLSTLR